MTQGLHVTEQQQTDGYFQRHGIVRPYEKDKGK